tara:strand:+ start:266 stop:2611 length:2346 start_codon:yes stop_codon:yes gene_type:complete
MKIFKEKSLKYSLSLSSIILSSSLLGIFCIYPEDKDNYGQSFKESGYSMLKDDGIILDYISPACETYSGFYQQVKRLKIQIPSSRQWSKNIIEAYTFNSPNIPASSRKKFQSNLFVNNSRCPLKSTVRISGDWKDHLGIENGSPIASMDVKLEDGNVGGITKFKLFLPKTRNGINEVVTANLFSYLGLLAPRTYLVQVDVNNVTLPYILQEKASKEFLEGNNKRESSMYKFDESLMWLLRQRYSKGFGSIISPVVINKSWSVRNNTTTSITNTGLNRLSKEFNRVNNNQIHVSNLLDESFLSGSSRKSRQKQSFFIVLSLITNSGHGILNNHNRRFYYNPFHDQLEPIYYDGNSSYQSLKHLHQQKRSFTSSLSHDVLSAYQKFLDFDYAERKLKEIDLNEFQNILSQSGVDFDRTTLANLKNELLTNLTFLRAKMNYMQMHSRSAADTAVDSEKELVDALKIGNVSLLYGNKAFACHSSLDECFTFLATQKQLKDIYNGSFIKDSLSYKYSYADFIPEKFKSKPFYDHNMAHYKEMVLPDFNVRSYGNPLIQIDSSNKILKFDLKSSRDKVVIHDGIVTDWKIIGSSATATDSEVPDVRFDDQLITSSLTIQDSSVSGLEIIFNGGLLEDSVNLVRVNGHVSSIEVSNSPQDALDIDFSDLKIDSVIITNSGNDCIDFSSGNYLVRDSILTGCVDKGISIGERSKANFDSVLIRNSRVAFVSKDSSTLRVENAVVKDSVLCIAAYRKKQEFVGARIIMPEDVCGGSKDIFVQRNSEILLK